MRIWDLLLMLLAMMGVAGVTMIPVWLTIWLYYWLKGRKWRKNVPIKLIQEVENDRLKKECSIEEAKYRFELGEADRKLREGEQRIERKFKPLPSPGYTEQSDAVQSMGYESNEPDFSGAGKNSERIKPARWTPI